MPTRFRWIMRKRTGLSANKGLTLIEVLVTVVITSIGLMGLLSLQMHAFKATQDSGNRSQAIWLFNDIVNRIRANEGASASYTQAINCNMPAAVCSNYNRGEAVGVPAVACSSVQLARWDLFEVACGAPRLNGVNGNNVDHLPGAQLTIACANGAACNNGDPLTITLNWRAKIDSRQITGGNRGANDNLLTITDTIIP